jgi:hypothetical protein
VDLSHLRFILTAVGLAVGLFAGMMFMLDVGRRIALRQVELHGPDARVGVGIVDGAVYAMLALLIGFSFSGAATRFDGRRALVAREVNAIGNAWRFIDLLPAEAQGPLHDGFRRYLDALLVSYTTPTINKRQALLEPPDVARAEKDIWAHAVAACLAPSGERARVLLLPSIDDMFSVVLEERLARRIHPPLVIYAMLAITALSAALFAGYGVASKSIRNWVFMVGIAATVSMAAYVIIELEYPRLGLIRVSNMDRALEELRATIH